MSITFSGLEGERGHTRRGDALLEVEDLTMTYTTREGSITAVNRINFTLHKGEALGIVGESGCGKTSVALSLMGLLPENGEITGGQMRLNGLDLVPLPEREKRKHRWRDIAMVFQGAMNAWNPVYQVGAQIKEAMDAHMERRLTRREARTRISELFELVGLNPDMQDRYPHEFSGGMRQRAVIAMALSCDPQVIIADEPTTALDVIVQDRILKQLKMIQDELDMSIIYISHDLAVIAEVTDTIGIMYAGNLVEIGPTHSVYIEAKHPYSELLLSSTPSIRGPRKKFAPLAGEPPNLMNPPNACRFHPRCPLATTQCEQHDPPLESVTPGHQTACWHYEKVSELRDREITA
jgi:peptide/nickel transport system ATP-binding protein